MNIISARRFIYLKVYTHNFFFVYDNFFRGFEYSSILYKTYIYSYNLKYSNPGWIDNKNFDNSGVIIYILSLEIIKN